MRSFWCWIGILAFFMKTQAQVGINTVNPKAQLDIRSTDDQNPLITDGLLIPRLENFPNSLPGAEQEGMLVYLKRPQENFPVGFYYWSYPSQEWTSLAATGNTAFFKQGTTQSATDIIGGIYRTGNIGIGAESPEVKLKVLLGPEIDHSIRTTLEVDNSSSAPTNVTYGILSNNRSSTDGRKYGIKTNVSASGRGVHYGLYNEVYQGTAQDIFGIFNKVGRTYGVSRNHYGIFTEIGTPLGDGNVYGLYSTAWGVDPQKVYAGYFAGRLGIGVSPDREYILPQERGQPSQVLALDSTGHLQWIFQGNRTYTATAAANGNYTIPDQTFTLQIDNAVSSVILPQASRHSGRILVLLGWSGISTKSLSFQGGDDLWDSSTATRITNISSGDRMIIQSTGNRWVVLVKQ